MIHRTSDEQIAEYYGRAEINQSSLKIILEKGMLSFLKEKDDLLKKDELYYSEKRWFIVGGAVDCWITQGEEIFNKKYVTAKMKKKPSETIMSIVQMMFNNVYNTFLENLPEDSKDTPFTGSIDDEEIQNDLIEAISQHDYYSNWGIDAKIKNVVKDGSLYWSELINSQGKQMLSEDEDAVIRKIITSLTTHQFTKHLFQDAEHLDVIFQLPLYFTIADIGCKALLDIVIINHKTKKIIPIDIKTMGDTVLKFNEAVKKRRYDIQASWYTTAIQNSTMDIALLIDKPVADYTISNFAFVVESTVSPGTPVIYVLHKELLIQGRQGEHTKNIQGYMHALGIYETWAAKGFRLEELLEDTKGVVWIQDDYAYNKVI